MTDILPEDREAAERFNAHLDTRLSGTQVHNLAGLLASTREKARQEAIEQCAEIAKSYADGCNNLKVAAAFPAVIVADYLAEAIRIFNKGSQHD